MPEGIITSLDHEARGITRDNGKAIFIEGTLPGEQVVYTSYRKKPAFEVARCERILKASPSRIDPPCPHFGVCGGCSFQHLEHNAQVAAKQRLLEDNLWHLGRVRAEALFAPIYGQPFSYRHRARLSAKFVAKKGKVLVGFHEKKSPYVADMQSCQILPPHASALLMPLRELITSLSIFDQLPQIELAIGDEMTALVLRVLAGLSAEDENKLKAFADLHRVVFYLQPKGPASAYRFYPQTGSDLFYTLPDFEVRHDFSPTEFTQVNPDINRVMVRKAMALLSPKAGEKILDMFCGLGNFTLPMARLGAEVLGIEGNTQLVQRATENAVKNGLANKARYEAMNLFEITPESLAALGHFDKMLIDPPREGAADLVHALPDEGAFSRIVYISCNPATLARDAGILVAQKSYRFKGAGVINMFPQTSHVESIALFER